MQQLCYGKISFKIFVAGGDAAFVDVDWRIVRLPVGRGDDFWRNWRRRNEIIPDFKSHRPKLKKPDIKTFYVWTKKAVIVCQTIGSK